jgi:hypothetical protein
MMVIARTAVVLSAAIAAALVLVLVLIRPVQARDKEPEFKGIMVEEGQPAKPRRGEKKARGERSKRAAKPRSRPRGSSTYIPPPVPSPSGGPPSPAMLAPPPAPYKPPPINSFGDRVTNCIHSFPLNAGVGNNPTNRDAYVRQCAN